MTGLLHAIASAAESDEQISQGKALSEREEAVLQALELLTRGQSSVVWIKAAALREKVAQLLGQPVEKMGNAQWIGHIIKRLHLLDDAGRKRGMDGVTYAIQPLDVIDMMRRYDVAIVYENSLKNRSDRSNPTYRSWSCPSNMESKKGTLELTLKCLRTHIA